MLHKLRDVMGKRDGEYQLTGVTELVEGFFSTVKNDEEKDKPLKRGRGSQKKSNVFVMVESIPLEGKTTKKGKQRKVGHIKMIVIDNLKVNTITPIVAENIGNTTIIDSDNSSSYVNLKDVVTEHNRIAIPKDKINELLP